VRAGIGHGQHAALVGHAVVGLVLEAVPRATAAGTLRAAALDHEIRDHAVEVQAVVEAAAGQVDEVGDRQRRLVGQQFDPDRAAGGGKSGGQGHQGGSTEGWTEGMAGPGGPRSRPAGNGTGRQAAISAAASRIYYPASPPLAPVPPEGASSPCPSKNCAISPSSPTSTTARPPSSTSCSSSRGP